MACNFYFAYDQGVMDFSASQNCKSTSNSHPKLLKYGTAKLSEREERRAILYTVCTQCIHRFIKNVLMWHVTQSPDESFTRKNQANGSWAAAGGHCNVVFGDHSRRPRQETVASCHVRLLRVSTYTHSRLGGQSTASYQ